MNDFKILIVKNNLILKEFELHFTDETTAKHVANDYLKCNFSDETEALVFNII